MVSYIKASAAEGIFGAVGDAAMQLSGADGHAFVAQWITFQGICILLLLAVIALTLGRQRLCPRPRAPEPRSLLPVTS